MQVPNGVQVLGERRERDGEVLTAPALEFLAGLHRAFDSRRRELLELRRNRQSALDSGARYDFLADTAAIRADDSWRVAEPAPGLIDRRVEITGPTDRKMTVNALNSGAKVWLADFEDANTPLWSNLIDGQLNLIDALDDRIDFTTPEGKEYRLRPASDRATIVVRPRGWHLDDKHVLVDGERISGSLFDFGLYFFHCARRQLSAGAGPYFYLPKLESHLEARLWNDVFTHAQEQLDIPHGTIRATVLIETIPAAFEMDEILYELRDHSAGLNAGRWDYLFSIVKKFRDHGGAFLLPERNSITMTAPFMRAYTELLVKTCHRRGAHAIGGMAAFIPNRRDPEANEAALTKVRQDKHRESHDGFDGSWVAHPDLVPVCAAEFDAVLRERPNQRDRQRADVDVTAEQLLEVSDGAPPITREGLRLNITVALRYLSAWLAGNGAVAIFNLMEDAATAEICRSQVWQWLHNGVVLTDGEKVSRELVEALIQRELAAIADDTPGLDTGRATELFRQVALDDQYADFLTLPGYEQMP